ncbi:MAG: 2,3-bisphosphoglycerate-independent phosphoglycerate mutase [Pseudohongiellaceae bacterium]
MSITARQTTLLLVLDGWGHREETEYNAIAAGNTPVWDRLLAERPHTLISTSGTDVGLPAGQMGNSEVGHMNLGAGRVVYQSLTRIDKAIEDSDFFLNQPLCDAVDKAVINGGAVHILGLLSPGGIHSHEEQIRAMIELAEQRGGDPVYLHAFLDGRDTPPRSALASLQKADRQLREAGIGRIASITGRYFAMDRDQRWDRVKTAWDLLVRGEAKYAYDDVEAALEAAYDRGEDDEFVQATRINDPEVPDSGIIRDDDSVVFMNFRADRARQLSQVFVDESFDGFDRGPLPGLSDFVTLTEYSADLGVPVAFPPQPMDNVLGEYLARNGRTQLRIAETEKYAHVTFFFSGGREKEYEGETRILIPSPSVATYDLQPEMSAPEVTDRLVEAIRSGQYDTIVCNYANGDMVGHSGDFDAAVKAVECVDECLGRIVGALEETGGQCLITADHGNVEQMVDPASGQPLTSHTSGPVPLVYVGDPSWRFDREGSLSDIAPTMLALMDMPVPDEMTGTTLMSRS